MAERKSTKAAANRAAGMNARASRSISKPLDNLIPTSKIRKLMGGISLVTLWRWRRSPAMAFPPLKEINGRLYGSEQALLAWRENQKTRHGVTA